MATSIVLGAFLTFAEAPFYGAYANTSRILLVSLIDDHNVGRPRISTRICCPSVIRDTASKRVDV